MSRIGKKPIQIPQGVTIDFKDGLLKVKGPKGELSMQIPPVIGLKIENNEIIVFKAEENELSQKLWGTIRSVVNNMVVGVSQGFKKQLQLVGVGYRATVQGNNLNLSLGFSHPVIFPLPKGVTAKVEQNVITLESHDKVLLGNTAAKIRSLRPPEPYKGKGVMYVDEHIIRKAGKAGAKK